MLQLFMPTHSVPFALQNFFARFALASSSAGRFTPATAMSGLPGGSVPKSIAFDEHGRTKSATS
jgi:hypothetical protein